jgi:2-phospho-L-lactate guanylyltransferase
VLIPVRSAGGGKSRLRGATRSAAVHADLVLALQRDALAAVLAARVERSEDDPLIAAVHLVTPTPPRNVPDGVSVMIDEGRGLNAALLNAADRLAQLDPTGAVVAVVGDLPALRPDAFRAVLAGAARVERGFVADLTGRGTTMLTTRDPRRLQPEFGPESARRHRESGAVPLVADDRARSDVDTAADLQHCLMLGVGEHTGRMLAHLQPFT